MFAPGKARGRGLRPRWESGFRPWVDDGEITAPEASGHYENGIALPAARAEPPHTVAPVYGGSSRCRAALWRDP